MKNTAIEIAYIIDSSSLVNILFVDEITDDQLQRVFKQFECNTIELYAPNLLKDELTNVLKSAVRRKRATEQDVLVILEKFLRLPIVYSAVNYRSVLEVALRENISAYDAEYIVLSRQLKAPLLTLDKRLSGLV
ncbi:MAG: hypothetical protein A3J72_06280 [Nitrospirae bacterium RIFCSPHIGHO2_02_FULL_40_19]|nr:MAG: hypothetical protein A3J72_06280 [Nitrospirae bacterium RIFCSPHIGHO2_02_FULL_40_19]